MDTRLLEDALALIEEGTMSAAALRRNVTQPAFSRRIKALEHWLGAPLVERHVNKVVLTEALLAREVEIRAILETLNQFRRSSGSTRRSFIAAAQHSLATSVFPEIYPRIQALDGIDRVRLRTRNQDEIIALFLKFEVDLILSYQYEGAPRLPFDETVIRRTWRRDSLVPVVGGALRFLLAEDQTLTEPVPALRYPAESEFGRIIGAYAPARDLLRDEVVVVESAFAASVVSLIKLGAGVGWVPQSLVRDEMRRGEVVPISAAYGRIPLDVELSTHRTNAMGRLVLDTLVPA
ncbi:MULTISPECIES: LysR family transcriptional regulator [unclassified Dinoroseobacter]|uniref:LysR family transcriptional regulator n=1 Tax=unclassified Dinoroseobacter TaxID=2620028 RepID=UPI003C7DF8E5